jgi:hypothetical protein
LSSFTKEATIISQYHLSIADIGMALGYSHNQMGEEVAHNIYTACKGHYSGRAILKFTVYVFQLHYIAPAVSVILSHHNYINYDNQKSFFIFVLY